MSNYDPWVYPDPNNGGFSTAWTMVARGDGQRWAQVGWIEYAYDYRYTFVQYKYNDVTYTYDYSPQPSGSGQFSSYATLYAPGHGPYPPVWTFQVNGSTIQTVQSLQWIPTQGQISGETVSAATQMPGSINEHQIFWGNQIEYSDAWNTFHGSPITTNSNYHGYTPTIATSVGEIWDKACTS